MQYTPKNFDHLLGLAGFSDTLLKNHFTLYEGYVTNTNKLVAALRAMGDEGKSGTPEYAEIKRRIGWEFNGMRLHEYYFGNMAKGAAALPSGAPLAKKITESFGSYEAWKKDFRATAGMRGIGWGILYHDRAADHLFNIWVNEHDVGHLAGANPLLIVDVFEHAYVFDYGLKRADYVEAFIKAIDWSTVEQRFLRQSKNIESASNN